LVLDGLSKDLNSGATSQTNEIARDHSGLLFRTLQKVEIAGNLTLRRRLETPLRLLTSSERRELRRMDHRQMHVISFAVACFQLGFEVRADEQTSRQISSSRLK
jgi:hypothetical protein